MTINGENIRRDVGLWRAKKRTLSAKGDMDSLVSFTEAMNALSRSIVSEFGETDPEFYESLSELANNAATLTTKDARIFVNGQDRTNL